jgi:putative membrane protein
MIEKLPLVNACINTAVAGLLIVGYVLIRRRKLDAHKWVMLSALALSALFLASYVTYHVKHGSTKFPGVGFIRPVYFTILISHTVLAVVNLPFVIMTVARGLTGDFARHKKIAKRTWAVWLYVAITGPVVYVMLYQLYPGAAGAFEEAQRLHRANDEASALEKYMLAANAGDRASACYAATLADRLHATETASAAIANALKEDPNEPHCLTLSARALVYEGRAADAIPILEGVTKAHPENAFFWASLGFAHFAKWEYKEAAAAFEASIARDPAQPANVYNAGYSHYLYGDYKGAKPLLERALAMKDLDPELKARAEDDLGIITGALWVCPMHPEQSGKPGEKCPICGMPLEVAPHGLIGED